MVIRGEGCFQLSGVLGGSEGVLREGNGVHADEEGGGWGFEAVQGGAGDGRGGGAGVHFIPDLTDERWVPGEDPRRGCLIDIQINGSCTC